MHNFSTKQHLVQPTLLIFHPLQILGVSLVRQDGGIGSVWNQWLGQPQTQLGGRVVPSAQRLFGPSFVCSSLPFTQALPGHLYL